MFSYVYFKLLKKMRGSAIRSSFVHPTSKVESGSDFINSSMEKYSFCGYNCDISNTRIGSFCSIANGVIIGGGMHPMDWVCMSPVFYEGRDSVKKKFSNHVRSPSLVTTIGHDVWIGRNALVGQGLRIGTGSVVGMGSVVTKDVPPYAVVVGVPAKVIRYRFSDDVISALLKSKWWELEEERLEVAANFIKSPVDFLNALEGGCGKVSNCKKKGSSSL